ncbi:hypothetical protein ACWERY_29720 [Streptomyces sp. NPDC004082]|uniref:hypothetical protein n=1 Tax=unclassified Streptomyces TaxID=2593676 RepID=UPI0033A865B4
MAGGGAGLSWATNAVVVANSMPALPWRPTSSAKLHGLGMPDNPGLARLRAVLEESGFALIAAQTPPNSPRSPHG